MKVLGLIDSFKGTLTSIELGQILTEELKNKGIDIDYIPISDGGDGFLDSIEYIYKLSKIYLTTYDPLFREINTYYLYDELTNTAYIELAKTAGLNLLKREEYNPFLTSTAGCGEVIKHAIINNIKNVVIGIGGTSTNDGGSGMLSSLGVKFYDEDNNLIDRLNNKSLQSIKYIDISSFDEIIKGINFLVVSDVKNELLGKNGATYTYAPQKGAKFEELETLETNLEMYSSLIEKLKGSDFLHLKGSGAAGGVGFAFASMFNARIVTGIDYILDLIDFDSLKNNYDYIITGEGKIDKQSFSGKVVFEIVKRAYPIKVILLSAINDISDTELINKGVYKSYKIVDEITDLDTSLKYPYVIYRELVKQIRFNEFK